MENYGQKCADAGKFEWYLGFTKDWEKISENVWKSTGLISVLAWKWNFILGGSQEFSE